LSAIPSPRCPRRATTSRSTTPSLDKEFPVAVAASDGRRDGFSNHPIQAAHEAGDVTTDRRVDHVVAHDALFYGAAIGFELRLNQRHNCRAGFQKSIDAGQDQLE